MLDQDHLGVTNTAEAVHHHLNGLEKDTSREERRVGDHRWGTGLKMSTLLTDLEKAGQTTETDDLSKKWTIPGDHQSIGRERKTWCEWWNRGRNKGGKSIVAYSTFSAFVAIKSTSVSRLALILYSLTWWDRKQILHREWSCALRLCYSSINQICPTNQQPLPHSIIGEGLCQRSTSFHHQIMGPN